MSDENTDVTDEIEEIGHEVEGETEGEIENGNEDETGDDPVQQITVEDLKAELPEQDYETLTLGEETVAVRSLLKAKVAVKGMVMSAGHAYDESNEVCREATLKYALYELFAFVGQENRAREKLEDCQLLIETYFGPIIKKSDAEKEGPAVGVMSRGRRSPIERRRS